MLMRIYFHKIYHIKSSIVLVLFDFFKRFFSLLIEFFDFIISYQFDNFDLVFKIKISEIIYTTNDL